MIQVLNRISRIRQHLNYIKKKQKTTVHFLIKKNRLSYPRAWKNTDATKFMYDIDRFWMFAIEYYAQMFSACLINMHRSMSCLF